MCRRLRASIFRATEGNSFSLGAGVRHHRPSPHLECEHVVGEHLEPPGDETRLPAWTFRSRSLPETRPPRRLRDGGRVERLISARRRENDRTCPSRYVARSSCRAATRESRSSARPLRSGTRTGGPFRKSFPSKGGGSRTTGASKDLLACARARTAVRAAAQPDVTRGPAGRAGRRAESRLPGRARRQRYRRAALTSAFAPPSSSWACRCRRRRFRPLAAVSFRKSP